jgi:hypothetical protein
MVDPAANRLVDTQSSQELSTVSIIARAIASVKVSPRSLAMDLQAATDSHPLPAPLGEIPRLAAAIPGLQRFRWTVAQFTGMMNLQKALPAPTQCVEHHIVTKRPLTQPDFASWIQRNWPPPRQNSCSWSRRAWSGGQTAHGPPRYTWSRKRTVPGAPQ